MISFATQFGHAPTHSERLNASGASAICERPWSITVGLSLPDQSQDDADRKERLRHHAACRDAAQEEFTRHRLPHDQCAAEYHQAQIDRLIEEMA